MGASNATPAVQPDPIAAGLLVLRPFTVADTRRIFELSHEDGLRTWLPDQVYADEAQARGVLEYLIAQYPVADPRKAPYVLAACLASSGELVGHVGFSAIPQGVEIGFAMADAHQGRGLGRQAVMAGTAWALAAFGLDAVQAIVAEDNVASWRLLQASGYREVDTRVRRLHGVERRVRTYRYPPPA